MADPDPDAKDYKWLVARERGDDIGDVPASERAPYEQLGALLGSGVSPSAGWKQRVLERIDAAERAEAEAAETAAREAEVAAKPVVVAAEAPSSIVVDLDTKLSVEPAPAKPAVAAKPAAKAEKSPAPVASLDARRRRTRWMIVGTAVAAAAAAVLFIALPKRGDTPGAAVATLDTKIIIGPNKVRSMRDGDTTIPLGSTYAIEASAAGPVELRVYGGSGEKLLAACSKTAQDRRCNLEGNRLRLMVLIEAPGTVRAVMFFGQDVRPSTGSYVGDVEAAESAKIQYKESKARRAI